MHAWTVGGAIIESDDGLLLVQNLRRGGRLDWSPPGGVIDGGEDLVAGLTREVLEETGLEVLEWTGPAYRITTAAPGLGWTLSVEVWVATAYAGDLAIADPDGIVVDARFVTAPGHVDLLAGNHPWVVEPLCEYLDERWSGCRSFRYHVEGDAIVDAVVSRR